MMPRNPSGTPKIVKRVVCVVLPIVFLALYFSTGLEIAEVGADGDADILQADEALIEGSAPEEKKENVSTAEHGVSGEQRPWSSFCVENPDALECAFYRYVLATKKKVEDYPGHAFGEITECPPVDLADIVGFRMDFYAKLFPTDICADWMGLEIGALDHPAAIPPLCDESRKFVDKFPVDQLQQFHPEAKPSEVIDPELLDDATTFETVKDNVLDYVIASHLLENMEDPIEAVFNLVRVLKPGGRLIVMVANKCHTLSRQRIVTSWEHMATENRDKDVQPINILEHQREWGISHLYRHTWKRPVSSPVEGELELGLEQLQQEDFFSHGSWHVHTWDATSWSEFLESLDAHLAERKGESWPGIDIQEQIAHSVDLAAVIVKRGPNVV